GGDCADSEPERVLLRQPSGPANLVLDLLGIRRGVARPLTGHAEALLYAAGLVRRAFLRARLDVGLVARRIDGVPHAPAGVHYLVADRVRVFAHCTSSFTDS